MGVDNLVAKLVTGFYAAKRKRYEGNTELAFKSRDLMQNYMNVMSHPDWLLMNYDDTLMDVPALQTVLSLMLRPSTWPWYFATADAFQEKGLKQLEASKQESDSLTLRQKWNLFKLGGKQAQSDRWERFCLDFLVETHDGEPVRRSDGSLVYTGLARECLWSSERAGKLLYPGAKEFVARLLRKNPGLNVGIISRDIEPIVRAGYEALGIPFYNIRRADYLISDKLGVIDNYDIRTNQHVVFIWDSAEDIPLIGAMHEMTGSRSNILSVQVVDNPEEVYKDHADAAILKNYGPLIRSPL
jgi:hypothetical protein